MSRRVSSRPLTWMIAFIAGCYSWQLGPGGAEDGATPPDATSRDAGRDAPQRGDATSDAHDARQPAEAETQPHDSTPDCSGVDASCASLLAQVNEARAQATACTVGEGECLTSVLDPCGCKVFVAEATSAPTQSYVTAVKAFKGAGCAATSCGTCTVATVGGCVDNLTEAGAVASGCVP